MIKGSQYGKSVTDNVDEAAKLLGICRSLFYSPRSEDKLPAPKHLEIRIL